MGLVGDIISGVGSLVSAGSNIASNVLSYQNNQEVNSINRNFYLKLESSFLLRFRKSRIICISERISLMCVRNVLTIFINFSFFNFVMVILY